MCQYLFILSGQIFPWVCCPVFWSSFTTISTKILIISQFWSWVVMESLWFSLFFYFSFFSLKIIIHGCRRSIILTFHISRSILLDFFFFFFFVFWVLITLVFLILVFVISAKTVKPYLFLTIVIDLWLYGKSKLKISFPLIL